MRRIGWIGLGRMGWHMAQHLDMADWLLMIYNRSPEKTEQFAAESQARRRTDTGTVVARTPAELAAGCDIIFTCVTDTPDVEAVLFGPDGVVEGAQGSRRIVVDMSTISSDDTIRIAARLALRGIDFLDAPVTGGVIGAEKGSLVIMVGGSARVYTEVAALELFDRMGSKVARVGDHGAGQAMKACNQVLCAVTTALVAEVLIMAEHIGLDGQMLLELLSGGAGGSWSLTHLGPKMLANDQAPGFSIDHLLKDLRHVRTLAERYEFKLPLLAAAERAFQDVQTNGGGSLGTQAVIEAYRSL